MISLPLSENSLLYFLFIVDITDCDFGSLHYLISSCVVEDESAVSIKCP